MKTYKLRIPAISMVWTKIPAENEEEAFNKAVEGLTKQNPRINWRDRSVWEIERVIDPIVERRLWKAAEYIVSRKEKFIRGDPTGIASNIIEALREDVKGDPDYLPHSDRLRNTCVTIVINKQIFTVGDFSREREKKLDELAELLKM